MITSHPLILKSITILKGDGNYGFFDGQFVIHRYPPRESFHPDPNQPDAPAFAHTGSAHEQETGIPGVGKSIVDPTKSQQGEHGEMFFQDEKGGHHLHGIDGVVRALGEELKKQGINVPAKDLVQKAIDMHNEESPDKNNHLPNIDSMAWRKIVMSDFQRGTHTDKGNYSADGQLITTTPNGHHNLGHPTKPAHKYGKFLESYTVPYHTQLAKILNEVGFNNTKIDRNGREHNILDFGNGKKSFPYIRPAKLNYMINPVTGAMTPGAHHLEMGHLRGTDKLPAHHMQRFSDMGVDEGQFQDITSWDVSHHLPDTYFLPQSGRKKNRAEVIRSANFHIEQALGMDSKAFGTLIAGSVPPNFFKSTFTDFNGKQHKVSQLLSSPQGRAMITEQLSEYPAFQALFGKTQGTLAKLHNHYSERYGDADTGLEKYMSHSTRTPDSYRSGEGTGRTLGTHNNARKIWAKALAAGNSGDGHSNFRNDGLSREEIEAAGLGLKTDDASMANAPMIRAIIEEIAHHQSLSRGHQEKRMLPPQEEIDKLAPLVQNTLVGGAMFGDDDSVMDAPAYMQNRYVKPVPPVTATQNTIPTGPPTAATQGGPPSQPVAAPSQPVAVTPPPRQRVAVTPPPPNAPPALVAQHAATSPSPEPVSTYPQQMTYQRGQRLTQPQTLNLTPQQKQRLQFASAPQEQVRQLMQDSGAAPQRAPLTDERVQQFQQNVGDPYQRFISQYAKSSDNPEDAKDRLVKAIEILQIEDARKDNDIIQHIPIKKMSNDSLDDIRNMAVKMDITTADVRTILHSKGDWERITKAYGYPDKVVKVVKVSFGGI